MRTNGHHGPVPAPDHTSILVSFALRIGRLEGKVERMDRRQAQRHPISVRRLLAAAAILVA